MRACKFLEIIELLYLFKIWPPIPKADSDATVVIEMLYMSLAILPRVTNLLL